MGMGKGLLDSLIAEGGVKSRDLSWEAWLLKLGDRNAAEFYGYPYFTFYLVENYCVHLYLICL